MLWKIESFAVSTAMYMKSELWAAGSHVRMRVGPRPAQLCRQRNDHKPQDQQKVSLQRGRALNRNRQKYPSFKLSAVCHPTNPTLKVIAQHQATSPRRPWHRIPSYEVKNLSGQIEQLAGQYYVLNWRSKKNASEFVWQ